MEAAFVLARFLQYAAASVLFGSTLLILWARLELRGANLLIAGAGIVLAIAGCVGLVAQTALLTGSLSEALRLETLALVMQTMSFGPAVVVRIIAGACAALIMLALPLIRHAFIGVLTFGATACISFAWSGHAAAAEGAIRTLHLASDSAHALAAAGWVGSLLVFVGMFWAERAGRSTFNDLAQALAGFSGLGIALVGVIFLTGLANTMLILGTDPSAIGQTAYGRLLIAKVAGFSMMLLLAVYHRHLLVPALKKLSRSDTESRNRLLSHLRTSLSAEGFAAVAIIGIVSVIGLLDPFT